MDRLTAALAGAEPRDVPGILTAMPHDYRIRDGEQQFDVPFEYFAQRLAAARTRPANWNTQRQELLADLRLVRSEAAALQTARTPRADPHPTLARILSRREFAGGRGGEWSAELRRRISEWFERIWRRLGGDRINSRTTAFVLATLAIVVGTIALAILLIRRSSPTHAPRPGLESGPALLFTRLGASGDRIRTKRRRAGSRAVRLPRGASPAGGTGHLADRRIAHGARVHALTETRQPDA